MPSFGKTSRERLDTVCEDLQRLFERVVEIIDCSVVEGHRRKERQDEFFNRRPNPATRVPWPRSKHNRKPSEAVDVCPYVNGSLSWDGRHCLYLAGIVTGVAEEMGIEIRWGGDWDMDREPITDQEFQDLVHYEMAS